MAIITSIIKCFKCSILIYLHGGKGSSEDKDIFGV
jgi:hypothetical protein